MDTNVYKKMIFESPIPYFCIECTKDDKGEYIGLKISEVNKASKPMFNKQNKYSINTELDGNVLDEDFATWRQTMKNARMNGKHVVKRNVKFLKLYLNLEVYHLEGDNFALRFVEIKEEDVKLSQVLKKSPFEVWKKDRSGRYIDVNDACLNKTNKLYYDVVGKTDYEIWGEEVSKNFTSTDMEAIKNDKIIMFESNSEIKENKTDYYQVAKWPYKDKEDNILGTMGMAINITEKVEVEKSIKKNENMFLKIAEHIEEVFFVSDKEQMIYMSSNFERVLGEKPDEIYKDINKFKEFFHEEDVEGFDFNDYEEVCFGILRSKHYENKWLWVKIAPIRDADGKVIKRIGIISDITRKKEIEMELENLKIDFFANLSHELRTPINLIFSCLKVINLRIDDLEEEDREYFKKYLGILNQNGLRLYKLINNLIDTTILDNGHFNHNPQNCDIVSFTENICTSVVEFVEANKLSIVFDTDVEEKIIGFDVDNMERVILNLLSNAIKFNNSQGKIEVNINCEDNVKISIKDTGEGIPHEKLTKIFNRFEQNNSKLTNKREGSGIGLYLVKSLVEMHSGEIKVKSEVGKGSEFIITLPNKKIENEEEINILKLQDTMKNNNSTKVELSDIYI